LPLVALVLEQQFFFLVYVFEKFIKTSFVTLWDEEKSDGFYIDEKGKGEAPKCERDKRRDN
jgi:hypothetical protein